MQKIIYKYFAAWDFDKEELWLNEMSSKGFQLEEVSAFRYVFKQANAGEYSYRIELLENLPTHVASAQYIKFLEETGVEQIGNYIRWVYFRRKSTDGKFELFSDIDSRIKHLEKILFLLGAILCMLFTIFTATLLTQPFNRYFYSSPFLLLLPLFIIFLSVGVLKTAKTRKRLIKERVLHE